MISVSYLKSKYDELTTIKLIDESIADLIHVDLMDGLYVPNKNFELKQVIKLLTGTKKMLDIHLMVNDPLEYIEELSTLNVKIITIHLDSTNNLEKTIQMIKDKNILVGVAINPDENVDILNDYLDKIDYVLIMSVYPGKGGQTFISEVTSKVRKLQDKDILIGIDGGINKDTVHYLKDLSIDNIISGSFICMSDDFNARIKELQEGLGK